MATTAGVGRSTAENSREAGRGAAEAALARLPGGRADVMIVFGTAGHDQRQLVSAVRGVAEDAELVGCSGEGVISEGNSLECDHAVAVMAIQSDALSFETFLLRDYGDDPAARGGELARRIRQRGEDDIVGLLVFPDGLSGNCTDFLAALDRELPGSVVVAGGTSADAMAFERTYQYAGDEVASNSISALLLRGSGSMEYEVSHGCAPIGLERVVTRAEGGWVYEIDGQPAWSVFKEYLDGDPEELNAEGIVHLCIGEPLDRESAAAYEPYVIRTPLSLDKSNGALYFPGGGLRSNQTIQLTRRDPERIRQSATACARRILDHRPSSEPAFVLQFDCAGRGKILFGAGASEVIVQPLQETLGKETPWLGFHTYGEIAPIRDRLYYHNYTVVLCAVYDAA